MKKKSSGITVIFQSDVINDCSIEQEWQHGISDIRHFDMFVFVLVSLYLISSHVH